MTPTHAMVLAAGLGLRMRPLTEQCPKPLIPVAGRTMLDRVLDHLDGASVHHRVVNTYWLAQMVHKHLSSRSDVVFSDETTLLETGGGVAKALPHLGDQPFFVCNADIIWQDGATPALSRLAEYWQSGAMDALLLLQPTETAFGYEGAGDFFCESAGQLRRRGTGETAPLLFTGVQILAPSLFEGCPDGPFSLNVLYDKAAAQGRLYGLIHDGNWYHIGTPGALREAEPLLAEGR